MTTKEIIVAPFAVQADHPRNCDLVLQCIPGGRLRSTIKATRQVKDARNGQMYVPTDQARHLAMLPEVPGQILHVNPAELSYSITDPLTDDEELCARIKRYMDQQGAYRTEGKIQGVPALHGTLDKHRMKSLCREVRWLLDAGDVGMVDGFPTPAMVEIDELDGNYLQNPGSRVLNQQPAFEKDMPAYLDRLNSLSG